MRGYGREVVRAILLVVASGLVGLLVFATLGPPGMRPRLQTGPEFEYVAAYAVLALLFGLASPRHWPQVALGVAVLAVGLEALQIVVPARHARFGDLVFKLLGGAVGVGIAAALASLFKRDGK